METEMLITKDMTVGEVIKKYPNVTDILQSFGLHCVGCSVNPYETLEQGTVGHGISLEEMNNMINEANEYLKKYGTGIDDHKEISGNVVVLTESAANKVKALMESQGKAGDGLRVSVTPGGCAGFTYGLEFAKDSLENEMTIEQNGIKVFIDKEVASEVAGLNVDYVDSLQGSGFKISNPSAKASCGCGKSFR